MFDDIVVSRVSDALYNHIRHFSEHYADESGRLDLDISEFQRPDFRVVDGEAKRFIESLAEEVLSALSDSNVELERNASRYMLLPLELREFLESQPDEMLTLYKKMNEAVSARKGLSGLLSLLDDVCPMFWPLCNEPCFCAKAKQLVRESSLVNSSLV